MSWQSVSSQHIMGLYKWFVFVQIHTCNTNNIPKPHNHKGYIVKQSLFKKRIN